MEKLILNICFFLDPSRKDKCNQFSNEILSTLDYIINSKLFFIILILFIVILTKLIFQKHNNKYNDFTLSILISILFYLILFNFNTNLPWVDDWEWIENLQTKKIDTIIWLFQPTNIHNIFFVKLVFLINNNFFNLNFELFNYFSIFLIFIIILIFLKNEKIDNKIYLSLFVVLIFSGKQFANFSQASNIAWTICFFYIISFKYLFERESAFSIACCSTVILISPLTFGLGYVIPLFVLSFVYFFGLSSKVKIIYIITSLVGILVSYSLPKVFFSDLVGNTLDLNSLKVLLDFNFYSTFFGVLANVYLPWIEGFAYAGTLIGFLQMLIIFLIEFKKINKNVFLVITNFIKKNIFIILGLIFAFIVSITRSDTQTVVAARYSVGSIIFQIGFWLYFYNEIQNYYTKNLNLIKLVSLYVFLSGLLFPYHGIHWQAKRHILNNTVLDCFKKNIKNETLICNKLAYDTLFYGGNWYDYDVFSNQIRILKNENKSFLNF